MDLFSDFDLQGHSDFQEIFDLQGPSNLQENSNITSPEQSPISNNELPSVELDFEPFIDENLFLMDESVQSPLVEQLEPFQHDSMVVVQMEEPPQKKKRGRKRIRKEDLVGDVSAVQFSREDLLNMTSEQLDDRIKELTKIRPLTKAEEAEVKRQRRLIRNRESAQASRKKKKDTLDELQKEKEELQKCNEDLRKYNEDLQKEIKRLRLENKKIREENNQLKKEKSAPSKKTYPPVSKGAKKAFLIIFGLVFFSFIIPYPQPSSDSFEHSTRQILSIPDGISVEKTLAHSHEDSSIVSIDSKIDEHSGLESRNKSHCLFSQMEIDEWMQDRNSNYSNTLYYASERVIPNDAVEFDPEQKTYVCILTYMDSLPQDSYLPSDSDHSQRTKIEITAEVKAIKNVTTERNAPVVI